jgi:hypothetical protein
MDLPEYILRLGCRILEDNAYSSYGRPDLSWLPPSPSVTLPSLLSGGPTRSASRPANVMTQARPPPLHPDPDGVTAPIFFSMGGLDKSGVFSPLTSSDFCPACRGSPHRGYILTQHLLSSSTQLPLGSVPTMSSIAGSMIPTSSDSSESAPSLDLAPPKPTFQQMAIKDKPSDMGIKPITDKESWTDAKKIIDARLRRAPYWSRESKQLITTDANATASVWWEEVIAFYCKPPVLDLFVEESRFDGKGFEMIAHIDQHFNPSGAVDSTGYIFDLIDIKQLDQESVITLKLAFRRYPAL